MNKSALIKKATFPLITIGVILSAIAYIPLLRVFLGIDNNINIGFYTALIFLIGGYMGGLAGLISWLRVINAQGTTDANTQENNLRKPHLLGLSFLIPFPFISCLLLGWFWKKDKYFSQSLNTVYKETINFHLAIHLYLLVSFFLAPIFLGFVMGALIVTMYAIATAYNIAKGGEKAKYPVNIKILA